MACRCSAATALTVALLTGFPSNALAEAVNSTTAARSLRGAFNDCRSKNALCGSNSHPTAVCCSGLECQTMFGSFEMRCQDKPSPAPVSNTCEAIGCGESGEECECIEECLLRGTCCSDFNSFCKSIPTPAPQPSPAPTPEPPAPTPEPTTPAPTPGPVVVYGRPIEWSFDSTYCMSVDDNVFQNGQKMQLWTCSDSTGQMFQFDTSSFSSPSLLRLSAATQYCVVIDGNKNENGAGIQLWECDPNVQAQHWTRQRVGDSHLLRNEAFPDKCLVVDSNKGADGQKLQLWSCEESAAQYQTWTHNVF